MTLLTFNGLPFEVSALAVEFRVEFRVERVPRKRRRAYRVRRHTWTQPGCFVLGGTMYIHPEVFERLRAKVVHHG